MQTILEILQKTEAFLARASVPSAKVEAEWLLAHVLELPRLQLFLQFERPLTTAQLDALRPLVKRRGGREPLQYILGTAAFGDLTLKVDRRALIPRPETEELVALLLQKAQERPPQRLADLGTGSGAIALALAQALPEAQVVAADTSAEALALAKENATTLKLTDRVGFRQAAWYEALKGPVDWVISNPPYLTEAEWADAATEVREGEPRGALVAAEDGLADLRTLIEGAPRHLRPGGLLALETGIDHHPALTEIAQTVGLVEIESHRDSHGRDRFFLARRAEI